MDFREHPVSSLMAGLIEAHDRARFEVYGFSYGLNTQDATRKRLEAAFDKFFDLHDKSSAEIAALARDCRIEIAVDLAGYTGEARTEIMGFRAAPIQVNYLGYPGTMGSDDIDYIIGDGTVIPEADRSYYAEKIVTLPHSYQVNDPKREIADMPFTRSVLGLPDEGFVFCCFNNNFKILPATFDSWMRILKRAERSVLWLFEDNAGAAANLRKEAEKRGVDPERLIFAPRMARHAHLGRHRVADLFLDTLPYNAHTTASDALWVGLPVLTLLGKSFAGRVGASLVRAVGLPELVTETPDAYEALAVELATDPVRLKALKDKLAMNRLSCPLFNLGLFTQHIEAAYAQMSTRYRAGEKPDHITVKA
jgi:predicted O-linked N-acetylglucosamine transferase (SPINDLY family)